jgi:hypothetical protein
VAASVTAQVEPTARGCLSKHRYGSEEHAVSTARRRWFAARVALRAYACLACGGWHLTKNRATPPVDYRFGPPAPTKEERRRAEAKRRYQRRRRT